MSNLHDATEPEFTVWDPPASFRDGLTATERTAQLLIDQLDGQLLVRAADLEFLARRLQRMARASHLALPAEVT